MPEMLAPIPGLNRAQRRQIMRAQGWRGSKAKRQNLGKPQPRFNPPPLEVREAIAKAQQEQAEAQADHELRNGARQKGLIIPPSKAEAEALREQGHAPVGAGGLLVTGA